MVQLRLWALLQGPWVRAPVGELRPHILQGNEDHVPQRLSLCALEPWSTARGSPCRLQRRPSTTKNNFFFKSGLSFKQQSDEILESPRSPVLITLEPDTHDSRACFPCNQSSLPQTKTSLPVCTLGARICGHQGRHPSACSP